MRTMVGIDLAKSLVNLFSKKIDGHITGSLGPAGSQISVQKSSGAQIVPNAFRLCECNVGNENDIVLHCDLDLRK